jgi:hypothetical protein
MLTPNYFKKHSKSSLARAAAIAVFQREFIPPQCFYQHFTDLFLALFAVQVIFFFGVGDKSCFYQHGGHGNSLQYPDAFRRCLASRLIRPTFSNSSSMVRPGWCFLKIGREFHINDHRFCRVIGVKIFQFLGGYAIEVHILVLLKLLLLHRFYLRHK